MYLISATRIIRWRLRYGDPAGFACVYALATISCKIANFLGVIRFALTRLSGRRADLIEYRASPNGEKSKGEVLS